VDRIPVVSERTLLKPALEAMTRFRLGIVHIVDGEGRLIGIFTDGDIRRMLLKDQKPFAALFVDDAIKHANRRPTTARPDQKLVDAVRTMEEKGIWDLPVVDAGGRLSGLLHLHPAVKRLLGL
jgi:arabinose-5-phosphate isomerase